MVFSVAPYTIYGTLGNTIGCSHHIDDVVIRVGKNPGLKKKTSPVAFLGVVGFFMLYICPEESF
jgi:hypothetical protein